MSRRASECCSWDRMRDFETAEVLNPATRCELIPRFARSA